MKVELKRRLGYRKPMPFHVFPVDRDKWAVRREGSMTPIEYASSKREALRRARKIRNGDGADIILHRYIGDLGFS